MRNTSRSRMAALPAPFIPTLAAIAGVLVVVYVGLLAIVMTYGALQMQSAQALRDTRATVGVLETKYLVAVTSINQVRPATLGFTRPSAIAYVTGSTNRPAVSFLTQ